MKNYMTDGECEYVEYNNQQYFIDTSNTFDCGWETMIFPSKDEKVIDWGDLYCERYKTEEQAMLRHNYIVTHLNEFVSVKD